MLPPSRAARARGCIPPAPRAGHHSLLQTHRPTLGAPRAYGAHCRDCSASTPSRTARARGAFLQRRAIGHHSLLQPRRLALAPPSVWSAFAEIVLRHRPVERHAVAGPFLQRRAIGHDGLSSRAVPLSRPPSVLSALPRLVCVLDQSADQHFGRWLEAACENARLPPAARCSDRTRCRERSASVTSCCLYPCAILRSAACAMHAAWPKWLAASRYPAGFVRSFAAAARSAGFRQPDITLFCFASASRSSRTIEIARLGGREMGVGLREPAGFQGFGRSLFAIARLRIVIGETVQRSVKALIRWPWTSAFRRLVQRRACRPTRPCRSGSREAHRGARPRPARCGAGGHRAVCSVRRASGCVLNASRDPGKQVQIRMAPLRSTFSASSPSIRSSSLPRAVNSVECGLPDVAPELVHGDVEGFPRLRVFCGSLMISAKAG